MKKKSGVRVQNPEVKIHAIIQSEEFWLLDSGYFFMLGCVCCAGMRVYMKTGGSFPLLCSCLLTNDP